MGLDSHGESILMVANDPNDPSKPDQKDLERAMGLINNPLEPVYSRAILLNPTNKQIQLNENFKRLTLESIANGMLETFDEIKQYLNSTFFAHQTRELEDSEVQQIIDALNANQQSLINMIKDEHGVKRYLPSKLASAILSSSMSPDEAMKVYHELKTTMNAVALNCDLHLLYHLVPTVDVEHKMINWEKFRNILLPFMADTEETELVRNVIELLKISMGFVIRPTANQEQRKKHIKFFYALALMEIMDEKPLGQVAAKFGIYRGELQSMQIRSSSYCGMLAVFTKKLGWQNLSLLIKNFQDRLCFGVNQNLIDLMSISCLNGLMARMLYDAGFVDPKEIAYAKAIDIEKVFLNSVPVESSASNRRYWVSNSCKSMNENEISREIIKQARAIIETIAGRPLDWDENVKNIDIHTASSSQSGDTSGYRSPSKHSFSYNRTKAKIYHKTERLSQLSPNRTKKYANQIASQESEFEISFNATSPSPFAAPDSPAAAADLSDHSSSSSNATNKRPQASGEQQPVKRHKPNIVNSTTIQPNVSSTSDYDVIFSSGSQQHSSIEPVFSRQSSQNSKVFSDSDDSQRSFQLGSQALSSRSASPEKRRLPSESVSQAAEYSSHNRENQILFESTHSTQLTQESLQSFQFNEPLSAGSKANSTVAKLDRGRSKLERKQDDQCFEIVDEVSKEICKQIQTTRTYEFDFRNISQRDKLNSFVDKFRKEELLLIYFKMKLMVVEEKDFLGGKQKKMQNTKVQPGFLDKIEWMCVMFGTKGSRPTTVYKLNRKMCQKLKERIARDDFEFERSSVVCISFDAKFTQKMFKCCFAMSDRSLSKIIWHDPKVAHWLLNPDANEPEQIMEIAEEYLTPMVDQARNFMIKCRNLELQDALLPNTLLLYPVMWKLKQMLDEKSLYESYINVELPILSVFAKCELNGFTLDHEYSRNCTNLWIQLIKTLEDLIRKKCGRGQLNVRSPQDVQKVLRNLNLYKKYKEFYGLEPNFSEEKLKTGKDVLDKMRKIPGVLLPGEFGFSL